MKTGGRFDLGLTWVKKLECRQCGEELLRRKMEKATCRRGLFRVYRAVDSLPFSLLTFRDKSEIFTNQI